MMSARKKIVSPASLQTEPTNNKELLYNDVVLLLNKNILDIQLDNVRKLCRSLSEGLWAIDSNHEQFNKAFTNGNCEKLPDFFSEIFKKQYFDYKSRKRRKPSLSQEKLSKCANDLFDSLDFWSNLSFENEEFIKACQNFAEALLSYSQYLAKANKRMMENGTTTTSSLMIEAVDASNLKKEYEKVNTYMDNIQEYEPIHMDTGDVEDFDVPCEKRQRYLWFKELQICSR